MIVQYDLFETGIATPIPASRKTDPDSSKEAERKADIKGQRKIVLDAMQGKQDITALELAAMHGLDRYMVSRRLPELEKLGLVTRHRSEDGRPLVRQCKICRGNSTYWREVKDGKEI